MKKLFIILLNIQMLFALNVKELNKGDIIEDSIQHLEKKYYTVDIESGKSIRVTLTNLNHDIDLYIRSESLNDFKNDVPKERRMPTLRRNDCYSNNSNTKDEECTQFAHGPAPDAPATFDIMVYGYQASDYKLEVTEEEPEIIDTLTTKTTKGSVKKGKSKQYKVYGKAGETVKVSLFGLTADADLRLKIGRKANRHTFDCKSVNGGTQSDNCSVTLTKNSWVYAQVDGYRSASYSIKRDTASYADQLINIAKEHCLNKDNSTKGVLCSQEEHLAYILKEENHTNVIHIISTQNWQHLGQTIVSSTYSVTVNALHKLKNTRLFYTISSDGRSGRINFYYSDDTYLKSANIFFDVNSNIVIKTISNGEKLSISYDDINRNHHSYLYDIRDISNINKIAQ